MTSGIYVVTKVDNYGFNKFHTPSKMAFSSREAVIEGILADIQGNWEPNDYDIEELKSTLYVRNKGRHYGEYYYETEFVSTVEFE